MALAGPGRSRHAGQLRSPGHRQRGLRRCATRNQVARPHVQIARIALPATGIIPLVMQEQRGEQIAATRPNPSGSPYWRT